jgi:GNAT superfamily N-acetyltransferase
MQFDRIDPDRELDHLREFLSDSDPDDYLLDDLDEWIHHGRLWAGAERGDWLAFGRLDDLGGQEGWVSGFRVAAPRRGEGLGGQLLAHILSDARTIGLMSLRAAIEVQNIASSHLFARFGFRPVLEVTLRCGHPHTTGGTLLEKARPGSPLSGPVGWFPERTGYVDLLPDAEGGRFGRWRPSLVERWADEGKLYVAPGLAVAVQVDWWKSPRTLWVNPLLGALDPLVSAVSSLAHTLEHEEWQAFLPSTDEARAAYDRLGLFRHPFWGDRVQIFEWNGPAGDLASP